MYDGASIMSGKDGGVLKLLQNHVGRVVPYVHCFNRKLHLVVVQAIAAESLVEDSLNICNLFYKFFRNPTVYLYYQGKTLKRLLNQRWTGHLRTVTII